MSNSYLCPISSLGTMRTKKLNSKEFKHVVYSSRSFMVSALTFKFLIHIEFNFEYGEKVIQLDSFACSFSVAPTLVIEKPVFSSLYILTSFVVN